jgi:hypothetical protein
MGGEMTSRTIGADGLDELKKQLTPDQRRIERLEITLRIIRTWAVCWDSKFETPQKGFFDIAKKCDEVLQ